MPERRIIRDRVETEQDSLRTRIVKKYIDKYVNENDNKRMSNNAHSIEDLYNFLEKQDEVRDACGHSRIIRKTLEAALN